MDVIAIIVPLLSTISGILITFITQRSMNRKANIASKIAMKKETIEEHELLFEQYRKLVALLQDKFALTNKELTEVQKEYRDILEENIHLTNRVKVLEGITKLKST